MIFKELAYKKYHTGKQVEDIDNAYELYSDVTLVADNKIYFMKEQLSRCANLKIKKALLIEIYLNMKK